MKHVRNQLGMTLIEALAVIVIIGIVIGIGTPFVMNMVNDSSTQDFVSNAKTLEDAAHMHYRDTGVLPYTDKVDNLSDLSRDVIASELLKVGVLNPSDTIDSLLLNGYIYELDYNKLRDYTKVTLGDEGTEGEDQFIIIDMIDFNNNLIDFGFYENELSGFVFSKDVRNNSSGVVYSGSYKIEKGFVLQDEEDKVEVVVVDKDDLRPYGLTAYVKKLNNDGTADVEVTWTSRLINKSNKIEKGYKSTEYKFTCGDECGNVDLTTTDLITTLNVDRNAEDFEITLVSTKMERGINTPFPGPSGESKFLVEVKNGLENPGEKSPVDCIYDNNGTLVSGVCMDEILGGDIFDERNDLFKKQEGNIIAEDQVNAIFEGLTITGLQEKNYIVFKEVRGSGSNYSFDKNRTRIFQVRPGFTDVLIPKNPYLQDDFQINVNSNYEYIIESYKELPCSDGGTPETVCTSKTAPESAVVVLYD